MERAVVLIGVSRTTDPGLQRLQAVEDAIDRMFDWAHVHQGIPKAKVVRITDKNGPVTAAGVYGEIDRLIDENDSLEQLIVYFAGHGLANRRQEYWLLSGAPANSSEAVNLDGSKELAGYGLVPHVIFISDACRTWPKGQQQHSLTGYNIFPSEEGIGKRKFVDVFYATQLGAPALEVKPAENAERYRAVYSDMLISALRGGVPGIVEDGFVRPLPLHLALQKMVPESLLAYGFSELRDQTPDAVLSSQGNVWVARIETPLPASSPSPPPALVVTAYPIAVPSSSASPAPVPVVTVYPIAIPPTKDGGNLRKDIVFESIRSHYEFGSTFDERASKPTSLTTHEVVELLVDHDFNKDGFDEQLLSASAIRRSTGRGLTKQASAFLKGVAGAEAPVRGLDFDDGAGFRVYGRRVVRAMCPGRAVRYSDHAMESTVVIESGDRATQALLEFDDGSGVLLPVIQRYTGVLRFDDTRLDEVWYEPSRLGEAQLSHSELKLLRIAINKATALGVFRLTDGSADQLVQRMQSLKFQDPALAVYAAYAYRELGRRDHIEVMQSYIESALGVRLFDLSLLSREFVHDKTAILGVVPSVPMLSQGWALIDALGKDLPKELLQIRGYRTASLWSHYTAEGVRVLQSWLRSEAGESLLVEMTEEI